MNVNSSSEPAISAVIWERPEMREALAVRDMGTVYRLLQRVGISQRRIAALTGQSQSEVSEIIAGRQVMAYDLLSRIADGLGIPRGYLGMAYEDPPSPPKPLSISHEPVDRRRLLADAAAVTVGAAMGLERWLVPIPDTQTPLPNRIGSADVDQLEATIRHLRMLDLEYGGGACRDLAVAQVRRSTRLLTASQTPQVRLRLQLALADLHAVAGWASFDIGMYDPAERYLARALELARHTGEHTLIAKILYCMSRLHLHRNWASDGLRLLRLGQDAAKEARDPLVSSLLAANEAWAHAMLNDSRQAFNLIGQAEDDFVRGDVDNAQPWLRFYGTADLTALRGTVYTTLSEHDSGRCQSAIDSLSLALTLRGDSATRSRAFELTALATAQLRAGDLDRGAETGHEAVDLALRLRSTRVTDRLAPLIQEARRHSGHSGLESLVERSQAATSANAPGGEKR